MNQLSGASLPYNPPLASRSVSGSGPSDTVATSEAKTKRQLAEKLLGDNMDPRSRAKLLDELGSLPEPMLKRMMDDAVRFNMVDSSTLGRWKTAGSFHPSSKEISLDRQGFLGEQGRALMLHEIGHAIDYGRVPGAKTLARLLATTFSSFFNIDKHKVSESNPEIKTMYQNFQARALADYAVMVREEAVKTFKPGESDQIASRSVSSGMLPDAIFVHQPQEQDVLVFEHKTNRVRNGLLKLGAAAAAGLGAVLTGGIAGAVIGGMALNLGVQGVKGLSTRPQEWTQDVGDLQVTKREDTTSVAMPKSATHEKIGWTKISDYVASTNKHEELFAEGVSAYLTSSESRERLQREEPELFRLIQSALDEYMVASPPRRP